MSEEILVTFSQVKLLAAEGAEAASSAQEFQGEILSLKFLRAFGVILQML